MFNKILLFAAVRLLKFDFLDQVSLNLKMWLIFVVWVLQEAF